MSIPGISILVPTYGRTRVLPEVIESFVRQDYDGHAEMIVLNDHPEQQLELNPPSGADRSVVIVNTPRFSDLGTKRNQLVSMAAYDWCWLWDDDDIYLPSALSRMRQLRSQLKPRNRCARESHCWQTQALGSGRSAVAAAAMGEPVPVGGGLEIMVRDSGPMWAMSVEVAAMREVGGFAPLDRMQDVDLVKRLAARRWLPAESNTPGMPSCLHRTAGLPYRRATDFKAWQSAADNEASAASHAAAASAMMDLGEEPRGLVTITPRWNADYQAIATNVWGDRRTVPRLNDPPTGHQ